MRWPADVLAYYVLAAGFGVDDAITAVALALAATEGDDAYRWEPTTPDGRVLLGAWAVPADEANAYPDLDPLRLPTAAKLLWALTAGERRPWDWLPVYAAGEWRSRLDDATAGVRAPRAGIDTTTGLIRSSMADTSAALSSAITSARASMLSSVEHLRQQT